MKSQEVVAIPFSSGLCSFLSGFEIGQAVGIASQSLFHQVCVRSSHAQGEMGTAVRRNPFFIRSVFVQGVGGRLKPSPSRNPFFIRSVFVRRSWR